MRSRDYFFQFRVSDEHLLHHLIFKNSFFEITLCFKKVFVREEIVKRLVAWAGNINYTAKIRPVIRVYPTQKKAPHPP